MKLYTFYFKGFALGGQVKVIARTKEVAYKLATDKISADIDFGADTYHRSVAISSLELISAETLPQTATVVHYDNGDY
jgi:hypothetical protein